MWEEILIMLIGTFAGGYLNRWKHGAKAKKIAKAIIEDPKNPITDPREALEQAVILINQAELEKHVETMKRQKAEHEARMRARGGNGMVGDIMQGMDVEIVSDDDDAGPTVKP